MRTFPFIPSMTSSKHPFNSPGQPVTINMGRPMPSWFDIRSLSDLDTQDEDQEGLLLSASRIQQLVTSEVDEHEIPSTRIVLGGFSQGGALSLITGLTSERKLGGVVCLSGWLPLTSKIKNVSGEVWWLFTWLICA